MNIDQQLSTVMPLLDYISQFESRGDYNIVWGGIKPKDRPPRPLTQMTVGEVLAWQDSIDRHYMSEAAGRYQIMEDTLRGLYRPAGVPLSAKYDRKTQDRLALGLLRRRGLDDYLDGSMSPNNFALALAKEWASLPVPFDVRRKGKTVRRGQSYYAGDGLNEAHAGVDEFMSLVTSLRGKPRPQPRTNLAKSKTNLSVLGGTLAVATQLSDQAKGLINTMMEEIGVSAEFALTIVALLAFAFIFRERLLKWAEGDR